MKATAATYEFAEQPGVVPPFDHWPDSRYVIGFTTNSNTFARAVLDRVGVMFISLPGSHPGENTEPQGQDAANGVQYGFLRPRIRRIPTMATMRVNSVRARAR